MPGEIKQEQVEEATIPQFRGITISINGLQIVPKVEGDVKPLELIKSLEVVIQQIQAQGRNGTK